MKMGPHIAKVKGAGLTILGVVSENTVEELTPDIVMIEKATTGDRRFTIWSTFFSCASSTLIPPHAFYCYPNM